MVIVSHRDPFEEQVLDVLLHQGHTFILALLHDLTGDVLVASKMWSAHVISTFKVVHLLLRQCLFLLKSPHDVKHIVDFESY